MPSLYDLKPRFQALLRPHVQSLAETGVTANHVTLAAVLLSFLAGAFIAFQAQAKWPLGRRLGEISFGLRRVVISRPKLVRQFVKREVIHHG